MSVFYMYVIARLLQNSRHGPRRNHSHKSQSIQGNKEPGELSSATS